MILLVIASFLIHQVFGEPIIGGEVGDIHEFPWLASIQKEGNHRCGGSIITNSVILTAAHCVNNVPKISLEVRAGSNRTDYGGSLHRVVFIQVHKHYQPFHGDTKMSNDIALIKVSPPFEFNRNLKKIQLAVEGHVVRPGTVVSVAGWGSQVQGGPTSPDLMSTNLRITDRERCAKAYGDATGKQMLANNMICAFQYDGDACHGDSGGPIVDGNVQVGIVSWGRGCLNGRFPGVYVDVGSYRREIDASSRVMESEEPDRTFIDGAVESIKSWFD